MKNIVKICILFTVMLLSLSGCRSVRIEPALAENVDNLQIRMLNSNEGVLYTEKSAPQIKFRNNSGVLFTGRTPIFVNSKTQIVNKSIDYFFFSWEIPYFLFDNYDLLETLLNLEKQQVQVQSIVIDAGHGGKDPGAVGKVSQEKTINLAIALKLKDALEAKGIKVFLSRSDDRYLTLKERTDFVQKLDCRIDLFISIHQNSSTNAKASGIETYYPKRILQNGEMSESDKFNFSVACKIQQKLAEFCRLANRGVKNADFYVLKKNSVPAILIECGFISNAEEEQVLNSEAHQQAIIKSIVETLQL